jgi:hypothetical protein
MEAQPPQQRVYGGALIRGQFLAGQPTSPGCAEQIRHWGRHQVAARDRMDLILGSGSAAAR